MLNTDEDIPQARRNEIVDIYSVKLLRSGYNVSVTREVIISGLRSYQRKVANAREAGQPLHRPAHTSLEARTRKKIFEKTSWFKNKNNQKITKKISKKYQNFKKNQKTIPKVKSVLFVPRSTGSKLCKMLRAEEQKLTEVTGYKIKIVERSGDQIRRILCKQDPFEGAPCGRDHCMVCKPGGKGDCRVRNVTYETTCDICKQRNQEAGVEDTEENVSKYVGETNRSAAERSREHLNDLKEQREDSHMYKHKTIEHPDTEVTFTMRVIKRHKSALERQVHESVLIEMKQEKGNILNSKSGYNRCLIPRLSIMMGDRVLSEEVDKTSQVYTEEEVETIFTDRAKINRKSRDRERDRGENNNNPPQNPPPLKRRKFKASKQFSLGQPSSTVCEKKLIPEAVEKSIVGSDCSSPAMTAERRQQNSSSESNDISFYSVFDKAHGTGEASNSLRKSRKKGKFIPPPTNNSKITDHFRPNLASNRQSNEPGSNLVRKPGEKL